jgi:hypothetical protein
MLLGVRLLCEVDVPVTGNLSVPSALDGGA